MTSTTESATRPDSGTGIAPHDLPALDGVRALACLLVLFPHAHGHLGIHDLRGLGQLGVMLFFVLSGFLMAHHYLPGSPTTRYWAGFLIRRAFRIYPAYALVPLVAWAVTDASVLHFPLISWHKLEKIWTLSFHRSPFWTIPVEVLFYGAVPLLGFLLCLSRNVVVLSLMAWGAAAILWPNSAWRNLFSYFPFFLSGVAVAFIRSNAVRPLPKWLVHAATGATSLGLLWLISNQDDFVVRKTLNLRHNGLSSAVLGAFVLGASFNTGVVGQLLSNPLSRGIGKISYSLYLTHVFTFRALQAAVDHDSWTGVLILVASAILVAVIAFYLIEQPFHRMGKVIARTIAPAKPRVLKAHSLDQQ